MFIRSVPAGPPAGSYVPAIEIANRYSREAPVDLEGMAQALGIAVNMSADLPASISGRLVRNVDRDGAEWYAIDVNGAHSENRRRFTLAHEIAHYILHRPLMDGGIVDNAMYRSGLPDQVEYEANRLAADLLMPAPLVRSFFRAGVRDLARLGQTFGASPDAVRIRLNQLRLGA